MARPLCVSLFDLSGVWSRPWEETHDVVRVDLQAGRDVLDLKPEDFAAVDVLLAAPPCTHFTKAGSRHWPAFDADGRTRQSVQLVRHTLKLARAWKPRVFALENPAGRLPKLVPAVAKLPRWSFSPWQFAGWTKSAERTLLYGWLDVERAQKTTILWGRFEVPEQRPEEPLVPCPGQTVTSWIGPGKDRANQRSATPLGFARAFFAANRICARA